MLAFLSKTLKDQPNKTTHSLIEEVESVESRLSQTTPSSMQDVETAVSRLSQSEDLIADGSGKFCLPTVKGQHPDLKSISSDTVCNQCLIGNFYGTNGAIFVVLMNALRSTSLFISGCI